MSEIEGGEVHPDYFDLDIPERTTMIDLLKSGGILNVLVTKNFKIIVANVMHARIQFQRNIEEDEIMYSGSIRMKGNLITMENAEHNVHAPQNMTEAIRKKLNTELLTH